MGFEIKKSIFNLGETKIDNIFIEEYMPHAPAEYVKIYIIALSKAQNAQQRLHIMDVARALETSLLKVLEAFEYWREKKLVEIIEENGAEKRDIKRFEEIRNHEKIKIIFKNIKDIHILNNIQEKSSNLKASSNFETFSNMDATSSFDTVSNVDAAFNFERFSNTDANDEFQYKEADYIQKDNLNTLQELNYEGLTKVLSGELAGNDQSFKKFIEKLEYMRKGKILSPEAIRRLAFYKNNLGLSVELLELACNLSYDNPNVKEYNYLNYARGILNNFYEANIFTIEEYYRRERQNNYKVPTPEEIEQQQMSKKYSAYSKGNQFKYREHNTEKGKKDNCKNKYEVNYNKQDGESNKYQASHGKQDAERNKYQASHGKQDAERNKYQASHSKQDSDYSKYETDKINSRIEAERLRIREKLNQNHR